MQKSATVYRVFERFTSEERATRAASHRMGHVARNAVGQFFYVSELVTGIAYRTRGDAERAEFAKFGAECPTCLERPCSHFHNAEEPIHEAEAQ